MAGKFIDLKDAAVTLGISPDELIEMRSRGEIFGYRDGSSWKFKQEEVERVLTERQRGGRSSVILGGGDVDDMLKLSADLLVEPGEDSVLLTDEKPSGPPSKKPTVIGDQPPGKGASDSDLRLAAKLAAGEDPKGSSGLPLAGDSMAGSITLDGTRKPGSSSQGGKSSNALFTENQGSDVLGGMSDVMSGSIGSGSLGGSVGSGSLALEDLGGLSKLGDDSMDGSMGSMDGSMDGNVNLRVPKKKSDSDVLGDLSMVTGGADASASMSGVSGISGLNSDPGSVMGSVDLDLGESGGVSGGLSGSMDSVLDSMGASDPGSAGASMGSAGESVIDDDEISLEADASRLGSDVTHGAGDSGIGIRSPADSGISLEEEPLDLGGSEVGSLELPEDEDVIAMESVADPDTATQLKSEEQFSLTAAGAEADEESDSGSQVIALEDSAAFEQHQNVMQQGEPALMADEYGQMGYAGAGAAAAGGMMYAPQPVETPYSVWNVVGLAFTVMSLGLCGMLMWDVLANMWQYDEGSSVASSLMDSIIAAVGMDK